MIDDHSNRLPTISSIITLLISVFHLCSGFTEFIHFFFIHLSCDYYRMIDQGCLIDRWYQMSDWINFDFFFGSSLSSLTTIITCSIDQEKKDHHQFDLILIWSITPEEKEWKNFKNFIYHSNFVFFLSHIITCRFCAIFFLFGANITTTIEM